MNKLTSPKKSPNKQDISRFFSDNIPNQLHEKFYDEITSLATQICNVPISLITLVDGKFSHVKSYYGIDPDNFPEEDLFAAHVVSNPSAPLIIPDVREDERFNDNPLITREPPIVFYAGVPICQSDGKVIGVICVIDTKPGQLSDQQFKALKSLAYQIEHLFVIHQKNDQLHQNSISLHSESERLRNIIEASRVATWEWNVQTGEVLVNERWAEMIGYTLKELEPLDIETWYDVVHPEDRGRSDDELQACMDGKLEFYDIECRLVHKDGHVVWINDRGKVVRWSADKKPLWMAGTHTDITERKITERQFETITNNIEQERQQAESQMLEQQKVLSRIFDYSLDIVCTVDVSGTFTNMNRASFSMLGYEPEEMAGRSIFDFITKEDQPKTNAAGEEVMRVKEVRGFENRYRHKDGHLVPIIWNLYWDQEHEVLHCIGRDDSERQTILSEISLLINNTEESFILTDRNLRITIFNDQFARLYKEYFKKEVRKGDHILDYAHPDRKDVLREIYRKVLRGEKHTDEFTIPVEGDSEERVFSLTYHPAKDQFGSIFGAFVAIRDITERKLAEQKLRVSEKRFRTLVENSGDAVAILTPAGQPAFVSNSITNVLGYSETEVMEIDLLSLMHPEDLPLVNKVLEQAMKEPGVPQPPTVARARHKDGSWRWMEAVITNMLHDPAVNGILDNFRDVTEQTILRKLDQLERQIMEASIDINFELEEMLGRYLKGLEEILPDIITSILKIENGRVWNMVSPSLPAAYLKSIHGEPIGPEAGSCGKAAYTGKQVISSDISSDPAWKTYKSVALEAGLEACWSQPIIDSRAEVVATFANYYQKAREPKKQELEIFSRSASLISILLENYRKSREVLHNNELFSYVNMATRDAIYDWDIKTDHLQWGNSFQRIFGHVLDEKPISLSRQSMMVHPDDLSEVQKSLKSFLQNEKQDRWQQEYRLKKGDGMYAQVEEKGYVVRDKKGKAIRMIGVVRDISKQKSEQIKQKIFSEVSQFFVSNKNLKPTLVQVLKYLVTTGDFDLAEIWITNREQSRINLTAYYPKNETVRTFYKTSENVSFSIGEGLPGEIWKTGKSKQYDQIQKHPSFIRKKGAEIINLNAGLGIPLVHNQQVIGVLLCATVQNGEPLKPYLNLLDGISAFLGAEINRKQIQEEMHLLFESAPDILAITAPNGYFVKVNPAFCELLGYSEEELTSQPYHTFIHPDDLKDSQKEYAETITGKRQANNYINRLHTKSGHYRWISWNSSEVFTDDGHVFSYGRDITEVKELQNLLDNASQLARLGGWEVDMLNEKVFLSDITREIHELDPGYEPDIDSAINFYRGDVRPVILKHVETAIETGKGWDLELPIVTAKGNERWIRTIGRSELSDGKCIRLLGSFQDIHDRKTAELRLQSTADNIPGVIYQYILHPDGTDEITHLTRGAEDLWRYNAKQCMADINLIWDQTKGGGDYEKVQKSIMESAENLSQWNCQYRSKQPNGKIIWLEGYGSPRKLIDGSILWDSLVIDITEKKELEELLERSSELSRIGSWEIDLENREVYWSPMTCSIHEVEQGYSPTIEEGILFYREDIRSNVQKMVDNCLKTGEPLNFEYPIITAKGNERWIRVVAEAERHQGKTIRVYGSTQDIHDRKQAEKELQEAYEEKNQILESIGDGFFSVTRDFKVTYWNRMAEKLLYTPRKTILGKNLWDVFADAEDLPSYKNYQKAMEEQEVIHFEDYYEPIRSWFEINAYPSKNGLTVYFKDITEQKKIIEQIRLSNERFEKAAEATNDAIWDWDIVNDTLYWGKGFQTLFGYKVNKSEVTLDTWDSHIHPEDHDQVMDSVKSLLKSREKNLWQFTYRYMKHNGEYVYVLDKGVVIRDANGKALRMVGAMSDITHHKKYEESLKELNQQLEDRARALVISNAELEQFAYVASHDLQEPLRMVSSFLTQLDKKYREQLDEKAHQYIHFAVDGAHRMRQIILDLLEFSRVGKHEDQLDEIPLNGLVEEVKRLLHREIEKKGAQIHLGKLPVVISYKTPLMQIFQNLISNAIKYIKPGTVPKITVNGKKRRNEWVISVKDNGIGIDKEYFDKIFVIFQRLHGRDQYNGTGMGLALVKKNIEQLEGKIWVQSKPGKGSTFYFTLPGLSQ